MTEYMVMGDHHDPDRLTECCRIIAALGDAVEIRRTVSPEERPS